MTEQRSPITPLESGAPTLSPPASYAGGMPAVVSSVRFALDQAGVGRTLKVFRALNQRGGFDCPSCAWPEGKERSVAEFCENGARAVADEATTRRVGPEFFATHSIAELLTRPDVWLNAQGRLTHPMFVERGGTHYRPVSWEQAFSIVGEELHRLDNPHQAAFYTSGRTSNEAAFLYQLFVRHFGTNNLPDCSNMCHESSGTGLRETLGTGKGTVQLEDFALADAIFVIGQNPGTNHPRMLSALRQAKQRGTKIVSINPLKEAGLIRFQHPQMPQDLVGGVTLTDLYLQVKGGGDIALLKAMMKLILERNAADGAFIAQHTTGFDAYCQELAQHSLQDLLEECGVPEAQVRSAAEIAIQSKATICCWAMGLTQHQHGVGNIQEVVNFLLLRGMLGKPGAGACPVRGHSNVQGDRTMGIWEHPPAWTQELGKRFGFESPVETGHDTVGTLLAMRRREVKVLIAMGGNFLSATPDTERTADALRGCQFTVHVATKLNRAHLVHGERALILPCLGRTEIDPSGFVSVEDSMSVVHASHGKLAPASTELRSEAAIVAGIAQATLKVTRVDWEGLAKDYSRVRTLIAETIPGFADFNTKIASPDGFVLRNPARELDFKGIGGRARFSAVQRPRISLEPGQLLLSTVRSHDQFNTTVYDMNDRYRGVFGFRHVLFLCMADLEERGLKTGDRVSITSYFRGETRHATGFTAVAYDLPKGCAAAYFPEANSLVPTEQFADKSHTPASKSVVIRVVAEAHS
jgi:molybdopterin-dependent oxidoreductase alpha subunit